MPTERERGEPLGQFLQRFVKAKRETVTNPKIKQRLAIAYSEAKRESRKSHGR